jgi:olefin beta-lactone synthetase
VVMPSAGLKRAKIVQAIRQENVTNSFGSPTLWGKIGEHCCGKNITLPSLRRVLCAGAAVPASLWENSRAFLPNGKLHSPYGATEALPITSVSSDEIEPASVRGACVGRPLPGIDVRAILITDAPIATLVEAQPRPDGEVGEIIARGPVVTKAYDGLPPATAAAKIKHHLDAITTDTASVWHRMGDCGYFDVHGRLWFCGRKAERVETPDEVLHTEPVEQVFRQHPRATRCALIGIGQRPNQRPAIVVETAIKNSTDARNFARDLRALALQHDHTSSIKLFYFLKRFPVDVRHNAKIHRLALAKWALTAKGYESDPKR